MKKVSGMFSKNDNTVVSEKLEKLFENTSYRIKQLRERLEKIDSETGPHRNHRNGDEQTCDLICKELKDPKTQDKCRKECNNTYIIPEGEMLDLVKSYPMDAHRLNSDKYLQKIFYRHARNPVSISETDVEKIPELYSMQVAVVVFPEESWKRSITILSGFPDHQKELVRKWKFNEHEYTPENLEERNRKVQRYSA
jgi:hypothetical protein